MTRHYQQVVVSRGLMSLPVQIRMMGPKLRWNELCNLLRSHVFEFTDAGTLDLVRNLHESLTNLVVEFYGEKPADAPEPRTASDLLAQIQQQKREAEEEAAAESGAVVGIDLGTTYSVVAHMDAPGPADQHAKRRRRPADAERRPVR